MTTKVIIGVVCVILLLLFSATCFAASYKKEGKTFSETPEAKEENPYGKDVLTDYTWEDKNGTPYPIYLHKIASGERKDRITAVIFVVSKKTGKLWRKELKDGEEIAKTIQTSGDKTI